ncbi:MAG: helix-turn-helix domain-containing protein [bacterium]
MKSLITSLQSAGLTELEANVYLYFLQNGPAKVTEVYKALKYDKSSTYRIVSELVMKNLLTSLGEKYGEKFVCTDENKLFDLVKEQQLKLKVASDTISNYLTQFVNQHSKYYKNHNITVLEGEDAYLVPMQKQLEKGVEIVRTLSNADATVKYFPGYYEYMKYFIPERVKRGIKMKILATSGTLNDQYVATNPLELKEVKFLPPEFQLQASLRIFGEYTAISNKYKERGLGILIKDKFITEMFVNLYELIWNLI